MSQSDLRDLRTERDLDSSLDAVWSYEHVEAIELNPECKDCTVSIIVGISGFSPSTTGITGIYRECDLHPARGSVRPTGELRVAIEVNEGDWISSSDIRLVDDGVLVESVEFIQHLCFERFGAGIGPAHAVLQNREVSVIQDLITAVTTDGGGCGWEPAKVALVLEVQLPLHPELPVVGPTPNRVITACAPVRRGICHTLMLDEHRDECLDGVAA